MKKTVLFVLVMFLIISCGDVEEIINDYTALPDGAPSGPIDPSDPTGVSASPGNGEVTISWNSMLGAESYNIYMDTSSGVSGTQITPVL